MSETTRPAVGAALPGVGSEGQRLADRGDGTFVNPIVAGDHADPTILKDEENYYMTFSSFLTYPGVVIWHSTDLVNWTPIGAALTEYIGSVWAMDLVKHDGRYYIYIPAVGSNSMAIYVIYADDIRGPWSQPKDLGIPGAIDPGHVVGEDGKRYLFVNGVRRIKLADDGLSTVGELEHVYEPWRYPKDWVVEMFAPEGPKLFRRGEWFYLVSAVGGTSGPPTSHMVTVARSRSIHGPWEDCPHNPIVRTASAEEPWWSRGHASVVEGPAGRFWIVYHGYENGFRTLGRQTLLEPIEWTEDGWFRATGGRLDTCLRKPELGTSIPSGPRRSGVMTRERLGTIWGFHEPEPNYLERVRQEPDGMVLVGQGTTLANCSPLTCIVGDRSYEATVELEVTGDAQGGLALFYDQRGFVGLGLGSEQLFTYNYGQEHSWMRTVFPERTIYLKLVNRENIVTFYYSKDGKEFVQHPWQMEVSGFHHNVFGGFLSLKLAVFAIGRGEVKVRQFEYRGLAVQ
jgi:xylan 1,4-beta-xylosidase